MFVDVTLNANQEVIAHVIDRYYCECDNAYCKGEIADHSTQS